jgi:DNA-binding MarR family transcriptional regulator
MDKSLRKNINITANELKIQYSDLKIDTFLACMATWDVFDRYVESQLRDKTISRAGYTILNALIFYGDMSPTEISKKVFRSKYSVSRAIVTLQKKGLIEKSPVNGDRRKLQITITARGLSIAKKGNIKARKYIAYAIFGILNDEEIKNINNYIKRLKEHTLILIGVNS